MVRLMKGNEAVVVGALYAGCDAFFGYPITPASEIAHAAAEWFPALGRVFVQAECETASINMVYGAGAAGKLSMTATSGPGMSLMQEGLSYMAGTNIPGVVVNIQRAGPGLGNVYPEQADYNQAVKGGGHGSYHAIVLAPASVQELCDFTRRAFQLAFQYLTPVIVFSDAAQGQMTETFCLPESELPRPVGVEAWAVQATAATRGNLLTSIFLDTAVLEELNNALQRKYHAMQAEAGAESYRTEDAEIVFLAYGTSSRIARTAVDQLRTSGVRAGLFRPLTLFPFPQEALCRLADRKLIVVEMSCGQFRDDVISQFAAGNKAVPNVQLVNRMGGVVIPLEAVVQAARNLV
ncbi:MAG: 3-methyl-2-oxobutanoate dehydrogenase subunit VorB [bacterium]